METLKRQDMAAERTRCMLKGDENALEQVIQDCFPADFMVADACLTNAESVWLHKHLPLMPFSPVLPISGKLGQWAQRPSHRR
jgi:hypothetical protein